MNALPDLDTLRDLILFLKARYYLQTARFPALRRPAWMLSLEPHVLLKYLRGVSSSFTPTAVPSLYGRFWFLKHPDTRLLYELFYLNREVSAMAFEEVAGRDFSIRIQAEGLVQRSDDLLKSDYRLVPWGDSIFLSDRDQGYHRTTVQYVYVGGDSVLLADFTARYLLDRTYERGLDLCAGTGFQGHNILPYCNGVTAAEYNPRAVDFARATLHANDLDRRMGIIESDLWNNVSGSFDIVVSNPPYYPVDERKRNETILDVFGGSDHGMEKPLIIYDGLGQYLKHEGRAALLAASPVIDGEDVLPIRLEPVAAKHGLETVLIPWKYTNMKLEPDYQVRHDIDYLIHYVILVEKNGTGGITTAEYPFLVRTFEKAQILIQKLLPSWPKGH